MFFASYRDSLPYALKWTYFVYYCFNRAHMIVFNGIATRNDNRSINIFSWKCNDILYIMKYAIHEMIAEIYDSKEDVVFRYSFIVALQEF